jgi:hypothetical protein
VCLPFASPRRNPIWPIQNIDILQEHRFFNQNSFPLPLEK